MTNKMREGPLVGATEVLVKLDSEWQVKTIRELLAIKVSFKVITWTGKIFKSTEAYASYEGDTQEIYRIKIAGKSYGCTPGHNWAVLHRGSTVATEARNLKPGFEIVRHPAFLDGSVGVNNAKLSNVDKPIAGHISSVKKKTTNEWVGCLTVPTYNNFMLATGVITGDCNFESKP